jgi:hypothetical protein
MNDRVIENGTEVEFLNGIEGRLRGIVNGTPLVGFNTEAGVVTYLPVFVAATNETMYVNAANVIRPVLHSVKA